MPYDTLDAPPPIELLEVVVDETTPGAAGAPQRRIGRPSTRVVLGAVLGAVLVAGLLAVVSGRSGAASLPTAPAAPPPALTGFAEMYVATYLTATGDDGAAELRRFYAAAPDAAALTGRGRYVTRAAAMAVREIATAYWEVEVAVDVLTFDGDGYRPAGIHHYLVGIVAGAGGFAATSLPARIPPPAPAPIAAVAGGDVVDDPATHALVEAFLTAYLTEDADLRAYAAADIVPVGPAASVAVAVSDVTSVVAGDGSTRVRVTGRTTDADGGSLPIEYHLVVVEDGATVKVAAVVAGPPPVGDAPAGGGG